MAKILCIHREAPNWDATEDRPRFDVTYGGIRYWVETDGGEPSHADVAAILEPSLESIRTSHKKMVDDAAEACRLSYFTPGAGMALTYVEKFAQAQAVAAMGEAAANALSHEDREAQFPTISASLGIEAPTLWACAQLVLTKYAQFAAMSLYIERARLSGKAAITAAATADGVREAYAAVTWPTQ